MKFMKAAFYLNVQQNARRKLINQKSGKQAASDVV
jgi:hypothetical protein